MAEKEKKYRDYLLRRDRNINDMYLNPDEEGISEEEKNIRQLLNESYENSLKNSRNIRGVPELSEYSNEKGNLEYFGPRQDDFGSRFDKRKGLIGEDGRFDPNIRENLSYARGEAQSGIGKIGSGIVKAVTTTGTTIGRTVGMIYGIGDAIANQDASLIFNNDITKAMDVVDEQMEKWLPTYRSWKEENGNWWQRNLSAAGISDFIKNAGFTIGSMLVGSGVAAGIRGLEKLAMKTGAKGLAKVAKNKGFKTFTPLLTSTFGEASMEAAQVMNDMERPALIDENTRHENAIAEITRQYGNNPEYANVYNALMDNEYKKHEQAINEIHDRSRAAGLWTMGLNTVILSASNHAVFGSVLKGEYNAERFLGKRVSKRLQNMAGGAEKMLTRQITDEEKKKILDSGAKKLLKSLKTTLSEGGEEMGQRIISDVQSNYFNDKLAANINSILRGKLKEGRDDNQIYAILNELGLDRSALDLEYDDNVNDFYNALYNFDAQKDVDSYLRTAWKTLGQTLTDKHAWDEFTAGALMGFLGMPTFGRAANSSSTTVLGKGKMVGWSGGLFGEMREMGLQNARRAAIVDEYNKVIGQYAKTRPELTEMIERLVQTKNFDNIANVGLVTGDKNVYDQNTHRSIAELVAAYQSVGLLEQFKQSLDEEASRDMAESVWESAVYKDENGRDHNSYENLVIEKDGKSLTGVDAVEEMLKRNITRLKSEADYFAKTLQYIDNNIGVNISDRQLRDLTILRSEIQFKHSNARRSLGVMDKAIDDVLAQLNSQSIEANASLANFSKNQITPENLLSEYNKRKDAATRFFEYIRDVFRSERNNVGEISRDNYSPLEIPFLNESEFKDSDIKKLDDLKKRFTDIRDRYNKLEIDETENQKQFKAALDNFIETIESEKGYAEKYNEYKNNPEAMEADMNKVKKNKEDNQKKKAAKDFDTDVKNAKSVSDLRKAIANENSRRTSLSPDERDKMFNVQEKIDSLEKQGNKYATELNKINRKRKEISEQIDELQVNGEISEEDAAILEQSLEDNARSAESVEEIMDANRFELSDEINPESAKKFNGVLQDMINNFKKAKDVTKGAAEANGQKDIVESFKENIVNFFEDLQEDSIKSITKETYDFYSKLAIKFDKFDKDTKVDSAEKLMVYLKSFNNFLDKLQKRLDKHIQTDVLKEDGSNEYKTELDVLDESYDNTIGRIEALKSEINNIEKEFSDIRNSKPIVNKTIHFSLASAMKTGTVANERKQALDAFNNEQIFKKLQKLPDNKLQKIIDDLEAESTKDGVDIIQSEALKYVANALKNVLSKKNRTLDTKTTIELGDLNDLIDKAKKITSFKYDNITNDISEVRYNSNTFELYDDPKHVDVIEVLNSTGAYNYLRNGHVKPGTKITFAIHPEFSFDDGEGVHSTLMYDDKGDLVKDVNGNVEFDAPVIWIVTADEVDGANNNNNYFGNDKHQVLNLVDQSFKSLFFKDKKALADDIRNQFKVWYKQTGGTGVFVYQFNQDAGSLEVDEVSGGIIPYNKKVAGVEGENANHEATRLDNVLHFSNGKYYDDNNNEVVIFQKDSNGNYYSSSNKVIKPDVEQYDVRPGQIMLGVKNAQGGYTVTHLIKKRRFKDMSEQEIESVVNSEFGKELTRRILNRLINGGKTELMKFLRFNKNGANIDVNTKSLTLSYTVNEKAIISANITKTDVAQGKEEVESKIRQFLKDVFIYSKQNENEVDVSYSLKTSYDDLDANYNQLMFETGMFYAPTVIVGRIRPEQVNFDATLHRFSDTIHNQEVEMSISDDEQQEENSNENEEQNVETNDDVNALEVSNPDEIINEKTESKDEMPKEKKTIKRKPRINKKGKKMSYRQKIIEAKKNIDFAGLNFKQMWKVEMWAFENGLEWRDWNKLPYDKRREILFGEKKSQPKNPSPSKPVENKDVVLKEVNKPQTSTEIENNDVCAAIGFDPFDL